MNPQIKAIETYYNGRKFRSRLETRWAVFMDAIDVEYEYEHEGYEVNGIRYLPDFWLPTLQCFLEIKPRGPIDERAAAKAQALADASGFPVYVFPTDFELACRSFPDDDHRGFAVRFERGLGRSERRYAWTQCMHCRRIEITWSGTVYHIRDCHCDPNQVINGRRSPQLMASFVVAKSLRFDDPKVTERLSPSVARMMAADVWFEGLNALMDSREYEEYFKRAVADAQYCINPEEYR